MIPFLSKKILLDSLSGNGGAPHTTPAMPADPSPVDLMAGLAINDMIEAMVAGGRPLDSAERIVGAMLAAHGIMAAERDAS